MREAADLRPVPDRCRAAFFAGAVLVAFVFVAVFFAAFVFVAVVFVAVVFLAVVFLAVVFLAVVFLAVVFFGADFAEVATAFFFVAAVLAETRFAGCFRPPDGFAAAFLLALVAGLFAAGFLAEVFFAAGFFPALFFAAAFFAAVFFAVDFFFATATWAHLPANVNAGL